MMFPRVMCGVARIQLEAAPVRPSNKLRTALSLDGLVITCAKFKHDVRILR